MPPKKANTYVAEKEQLGEIQSKKREKERGQKYEKIERRSLVTRC